jgi:N-acetylneuraminic acid mutarotase
MSKTALMLVLIFLAALIATCDIFAKPVLSSDSSSGSPWVRKVPMPSAGGFAKAGVVNNKIYVINLNVTYEYNLYGWSTKNPMPTSRGDFALTSYQNKIYCIGGRTNSGPLGTNEVYDSASDSWGSKTAMPTPRHGLDANVVNGKIYLIGGLVPEDRWPNVNIDIYTTFKLTNVTEVYDPATDTWTTKASIPKAAAYYASAVVNNKIYIISETHTQIYNPETDTWSSGAAPPFPVDMAGGATVTGVTPQRVYVIGGRRSGLEEAYNQVYNPENDSWSLGAPMPTPRYALTVAVADGKIYAIGGLTGAFVTVVQKDSNEQYDPLKDKTVPWAPSLVISILSPANTSYAAIYEPYVSVPLIFETNVPLSWVGYSLDGGSNVTVTNGTLIEIPDASRSLTLYANDTAGNWAAPQTVYYSIAFNLGIVPSAPFPTLLVVATSVAVVAIVGVGLLVYFKKKRVISK